MTDVVKSVYIAHSGQNPGGAFVYNPGLVNTDQQTTVPTIQTDVPVSGVGTVVDNGYLDIRFDDTTYYG